LGAVEGASRRAIAKGLVAAFFCLLAAAVLCFAVAMRFEMRKHELSGVPVNHLVVKDDGRAYYVPRMGGARGAPRSQTPLSDEQYRRWEEYKGLGQLWGGLSALCFLGGFASALAAEWAFRAGEKAARPPLPGRGGNAPLH
jgi:hypothetical protein